MSHGHIFDMTESKFERMMKTEVFICYTFPIVVRLDSLSRCVSFVVSSGSLNIISPKG